MTQSSPQTPKKSSNNVLWIILGCLGCGGLGFLGLGIIAAIALPSFLNQAHKAISSEAKTYVNTIVRAQQVYHLENRTFAASIEELSLGLSSESLNYNYAIEVQPEGESVIITATPTNESVNSYTGAVFAIGDAPNTTTTISQVCESKSPTPPAPPILSDETGEIECAPGSNSPE